MEDDCYAVDDSRDKVSRLGRKSKISPEGCEWQLDDGKRIIEGQRISHAKGEITVVGAARIFYRVDGITSILDKKSGGKTKLYTWTERFVQTKERLFRTR